MDVAEAGRYAVVMLAPTLLVST
ncbi:MAG: hypothetical protein QOF30_2722, partial [Acidimicrobiaceae bacterium]|nr:hypothetical protein [Acidimicrobiaceae bacterium]